MFELVAEFFAERQWPIEVVEGTTAVRARHVGAAGQWTVYVQIRPHQHRIACYSLSPIWVPEGRRPAVAEYFTRVNYGLVIGNFELDWNDGEARFKTALDVEGDRLSAALFSQLLMPNLAMMDRYLPGLMAVVFEGKSPALAVAHIESN